MPSIDLARLRKQALRLSEFFFAPEDFARNLNAVLDTYVNYTVRSRQATQPRLSLPARRTPSVVLRQIEHEIAALASAPENASGALALADGLWDDGWLESRLLAAFVLGRIPPDEGPLMARLTAWTSQIREPELRGQLLDLALVRMRREAPDMFLHLLAEWMRPERQRLWQAALAAALSAVRDHLFSDLPGLMQVLSPAVTAPPDELQLALEEFITALYHRSPTETSYLVRQALANSEDGMTSVVFRRMLASLPLELTEEIREIVRGKPHSVS